MGKIVMSNSNLQPQPEKADCMFQYARTNQWTTDIYYDTGLITISEAKRLWQDNLAQFIEELQTEGERPEMVIWTNCDNNADYRNEFAHVDETSETDGYSIWNIIRTKVEV